MEKVLTARIGKKDSRSIDTYLADGGYAGAKRVLTSGMTPEQVIEEVKKANVRGRGGAGFSAGVKWGFLPKDTRGKPIYLLCNADESEPGTFKDRLLMENDPHQLIEGMILASYAIKCRNAYIYIRGEFYDGARILEKAIEEAYAKGYLGEKILGSGFSLDITVHRGAGAYICGEESAMIESIEGKRGMPRLRPPYVAQVGLFGRPTLEHNMETLYWVRDILERGAAWFADQGRRGRKGLRSFSVSGRVAKPGVHLAPAGISVRELIDEYCGGMLPGHELYAYLPGGASGGILPASLADVPLDFDTLQPHGCFIGSAAIIVLSRHDRARDAALNLMRFFADESCGQCTPCRVGTEKAVRILEQPRWDVPLLEELSQAMADASICGLGQAAPNPVACVIKYFPQELE